MKVSVIVPTKNPGAVFRRVLPALCAQETAFAFDILVIDSGSTDGTVEYVKGCADPRVRLHEIPPAQFGHGRTRNLALSLTEGEYAAFVTHDACPASTKWLENLVRLAESDERIAGVFGRHVAYPGANPYTARELERHFARVGAAQVVALDDPQRYARDARYRQDLHFFSDNNALVRRKAWNEIPYPDVDFAEDQIWAQKIIEAGHRKGYAADAVVYHSHDFTLLERLRRSFDEAYAFRRLFGYVLCRGPLALLVSWAALSARDALYALKAGLWLRAPLAVLRAPADNLMRVLGHYLGSRGETLPPSWTRWLSRDQRVMSGALRGAPHPGRPE